MLNLGYHPLAIAEELEELPPNLAKKPYCRPYYGSSKMTARAIYQVGFFRSVQNRRMT